MDVEQTAPQAVAEQQLLAPVGDAFRELRRRHGMPEPDRLEDFPVHRVVS